MPPAAARDTARTVTIARRVWRRTVAASVAGVWLAAPASPARAGDAARAVPSVVKVTGNPGEAGAEISEEESHEPERAPVLVRPFAQAVFAAIDFDTHDGAASLEIVPNPTDNLGVTLGAWGLSLSLSMDIGRVEEVDEYGNSDNFNLEFTYPFRVLGNRELDVSAFLHHHQTLSMKRDGLPRQIVEDAMIDTLGVDAAFVFDPKASIASAFSDFMPRTGSRWSSFVRSSIEFWSIGFLHEPGRRLIPDSLSAGFGDFAGASGWDQASFTLGAGFMFDWNIAHQFFLSALTNIGAAGSLVDLSFASSETERSTSLGLSLGLQLAASFVSQGFDAGIVTSAMSDAANAHRVNVVGRRVSSTLFVGMRF